MGAEQRIPCPAYSCGVAYEDRVHQCRINGLRTSVRRQHLARWPEAAQILLKSGISLGSFEAVSRAMWISDFLRLAPAGRKNSRGAQFRSIAPRMAVAQHTGLEAVLELHRRGVS